MSIKVALLAAGLSTRMGKANKLLMKLKDKMLIQRAVETALEYSSDVYVITGYEREKVEAALQGYSLTFIYNPDYATGQEGSLRRALLNIDGPLMVLPADLPLITKEDYKECERKLAGHLVARPFFKKEVGHPVALSAEFVEMYRRESMTRVKQLVKLVSHNFYPSSLSCVQDVDTEEDYRKVEKLLGQKGEL